MATDGKGYGAVTGGLRRLLVALAENADKLPDIAVERASLETELAAAEEAKNRQDAFMGNKQLATQDLRNALLRAKDAGIQLQMAAKFKLGPRSEKLVAFQVTPLRKHGPRKAAQLKKLEDLQKQQADLLKQQEEVKAKEAEVLKTQVDLLTKQEAAAKTS